jgi:hypothetical protein
VLHGGRPCDRRSSSRGDDRKSTGSRSKGGTAVCRTGPGAAGERRSYRTAETEDGHDGQKGDHRGDKEALGSDPCGEGCGCGSGGGTQGSAREGPIAGQEGRPNCSRTKGFVHRNEETVGGEEERGEEKSGLTVPVEFPWRAELSGRGRLKTAGLFQNAESAPCPFFLSDPTKEFSKVGKRA